MNCPFCGAEPRTNVTFECFTRSGSNERTDTCFEREVRRLRIRIDDLDGQLAEWRDYAEGLEDVGEEMKDGATTPDIVAWDRQVKRRPQT